MRRGVVAVVAAIALALGVALGARPARAQDLSCQAGDREVRALHFEGNRAFTDAELGRVIVTTPSSAVSRLRIVGTRRCLDPTQFPVDVLRLLKFYRERGYTTATVDTTVRTLNASGRRVDVTFRIAEGTPLRLAAFQLSGMSGVRDSARIVRGQPVQRGEVFDRNALEAYRDTIVQRLHNGGYLRADAFFNWSTIDSVTASVVVTPGPFTRVASVLVRVDTSGRRQQIPDAQVRRTLGVRPGDPYSAADLIAAQRALYQTDAYRRVEVRVDTAGLADSLVSVVVSLQEGDLHTLRAGAGWASLDCFRTQTDFTNRYFMPNAQRLDVQARLSRIGIGRPLDFAKDLCPQAKNDPYSEQVNYYLGATIAQPSFFRLKRVPSLTLFTSRTSEYNAFLRATSFGALASLASRAGSRLPSTLSYQFEIGRTEANPVIFCAVFSACDPTTRDRLATNRRLGAIGYSVARDRTNDPLAPSDGTVQRLTVRHSAAYTGSDRTQEFTKVVGDASVYRRLGSDPNNVLIAHVQIGSLLGRNGGRTAPQQERLFAGGPTTVRGFGQNELGPAVYQVTRYDTVRTASDTVYFRDSVSKTVERTIPRGGNSLVVANLELQVRSPFLPELLALAFFTDAGEVWERSEPTASFRGLRVTPGAGVRVKSLFGVIRADVGYNPYARPAGPAYYIDSRTTGQALYCVSLGNTIPASLTSGGGLPKQATDRACPSTFQPATGRTFLERLTLNFWIGTAF